ncbi:MAG TPA: DUF3822 family protein [Bacteroidales bacterium]|nr:DUF3822 family protein [Bacteroidales bacterium]HPS15642.1 DUF3822 family protein [Bacteroidales bacterium]
MLSGELLKNGFTVNHIVIVKYAETNISLTVFDSLQNTFIAFEKLAFQSRSIFSENIQETEIGKMLIHKEKTFGKIILLIDNPVFTIIPGELYREHDKVKYLLHTHSYHENEGEHSDHLKNMGSYNVYWLPYDMKSFAAKHFLTYELKHFATIFTNYCLSLNKKNEAMYIHVGANIIYVTVVSGGKPVLCNAYKYNTIEDFTFYILKVYQKIFQKPDSASLLISGEIEKISEYKTTISKYIRNVDFIMNSEEFKYGEGISKMPLPVNNILFSTPLCV